MEAIKEALGVGRFASMAECVEAARALSEEAWGLQVKAERAERELAGLREETSELFAEALERAGYGEDTVRAARGMWIQDPKWAALVLLGCDVVEAARGCNQHKHQPGCDAADGGDGGDDQYKDSPVPVVKKAKSVGEVGAIVTPKPEWSDNGGDDYDYVVLEDQGNKILVQALGTGLPLPPTSVWMKDWAELSHEVTRKRTKVKK